jgi:hypothetical protein
MTDTGRAWQKPELIILSRSHAEERVLAACKHPGTGTSMSPDSANDVCSMSGLCNSCDLEAAS